MLRIRSAAWLAPFFALLLIRCAAPPPEPVAVRPLVPVVLRTCQGPPAVPAADDTDAALALYIVDLDAAGQDCRDKLAAAVAAINGAVAP